MSEDKNHIDFSAARMEKYRRGELSAADMYAMEKAALDDPFLADAMEGYGAGDEKINFATNQIENDTAELRRRLAERINKKESAKVLAFSWWKVAAVVLVFIGAGWLYTSTNNKALVQSIVKNDEVKSPAIHTTDSAEVHPLTGEQVDSLKDVASVSSHHVSKPEKIRTLDKAMGRNSAAAPPAPASNVAAERRETEKDKATDSVMYKDRVAASTVTGKQAPKPVADEPEQQVQGIATDNYKKNNTIAAGRANNISNTFKGTIVDELNKPLANATIQIPNLNIATVTDNKGFFSFKAPDTLLTVSVASTGFETQNLELNTNSIDNADNIIRLKPALLNLNEVVVNGYGTQKKKSGPARTNDITIHILDAEPTAGWNEYNQYLEKNKKIPGEVKDIHGEVVVSFTVDNKNKLNHFQIEKSLLEQLDAEAVRLIKEGPSWKLLKGKKAKASVTVKF